MVGVKDTGRSWLVLCAVTYTFFLETGTLKGLSVLLPDLKKQLGSDTWIMGSCISIMISWGYLLGLSASSLKERYGARFCFMMSGFICSSGLIVCACATNMYVFLLGIIMTGFLLLQENIGVGVVPEYFDRYYNIAVNVFLFGSGLGVIVFPPVVQTLLDIYGWRGALLLLSGLSFQSFLCGAIIKHSNAAIDEETKLLPPRSTKMIEPPNETLHVFLNKIDGDLLISTPFIARVLIPGAVCGFTWAGWLIYIVSFSSSTGLSLKEASVVATCCGIGLISIKFFMPLLNQLTSYRILLYVSSFIMATSMLIPILLPTCVGLIGLSTISLIFCLGIGMLSTETYVAARDTTDEEQYVSGIAWFHLFYGFAATLGAVTTGLVFDISGSFYLSCAFLSAVSLITAVSLGVEDIWMAINNCNNNNK